MGIAISLFRKDLITWHEAEFLTKIGGYALTSQETRLWLLAKRLSTSRL